MELVYVISCIFDSFVIFLLFEQFFNKRKRWANKYFIAGALVIHQIIATIVSNQTHSEYLRLVVQVVGIFLITFFYQGNLMKHILAMAIYVGFSVVSEGIAEVSSLVMGIERNENAEIILLLLVEIFMLLLVLLAKIFTRKGDDIPARYQIGYLFVPVLSIVVINGMMSSKSTVAWLVGIVSLLVINMISYYLLSTLTNYIMGENRKKQMEQQIENQKLKYQQLSQSFIQGNRIIHDVNKHHRIIKEYLLVSKQKEALEYMNTIDESFCELYSSVNSGNLVIDSIVGRFKEKIEGYCSTSVIRVNIDKNRWIMEDYDLVVVLGNITDNIMEAVLILIQNGIEPNVEFRIETSKTAFTLYSKNNVVEKKQTKKDKWYHGLGLANVKDTVEKYGGSIVLNNSKGYYETMIQIPMREEMKR